jgi:hypothetical protein
LTAALFVTQRDQWIDACCTCASTRISESACATVAPLRSRPATRSQRLLIPGARPQFAGMATSRTASGSQSCSALSEYARPVNPRGAMPMIVNGRPLTATCEQVGYFFLGIFVAISNLR